MTCGDGKLPDTFRPRQSGRAKIAGPPQRSTGSPSVGQECQDVHVNESGNLAKKFSIQPFVTGTLQSSMSRARSISHEHSWSQMIQAAKSSVY